MIPNTPGPRKLVMINSGVYPYAEIELDESVHLSGPNNAGKTTLLNAFQFLYVDHAGLYSFPESNFQGKTKPFYFKKDGLSSIIIENLTKWGIRTVGFHGLGAAQGCDWVRFGFNGPYEKDDFIDPVKQQPRLWEDVKANLSAKGYVELSAVQLRSALRGTGDKNSFRLELVPGGTNYDVFIEVFRQLMTLRKSKPDDLKRLLISVIESDLVSGDEKNRGTVILATLVGEAYRRAHAAQVRYEKVRSSQKACDHLFQEQDRLDQIQAVLPEKVTSSYRETLARVRQREVQAEAAKEAALEATESEKTWRNRRDEVEAEEKKTTKEFGRVEGARQSAQFAQERLEAEPKAMLEGKFREVRDHGFQIREDLHTIQADGATGGSSSLKARADRLRVEAQNFLKTAERLRTMEQAGARPSWYDLLEEFPEDERAPLLRLINPHILNLEEGNDGMLLENKEALGRLLTTLHGASQGGVFKGAGLRINLEQLPIPSLDLSDPVERARQIEDFETRANSNEKEACRIMSLAEDLRKQERLQAQLKELQDQELELTKKLGSIAHWEEEAATLPALETEAGELERYLDKIAEDKREAEESHSEAKERIRVQNTRAKTLTQEAEQLRTTTLRNMETMAVPLGFYLLPDDFPAVQPTLTDEAFQDLVLNATKEYDEAIRLDGLVTQRLDEIHELLGGILAGGDRFELIKQLRDLIEGLGDQKDQLESDWQHIAVSAKTAFTNLLRDFDTLVARVNRLNKGMSRFSVSNLSKIQLRVVENEDITSVIRRFCQEDGLYADVGLADKAKETIGDWLSKEASFRLFDLFHVQVEVSKGSETKVYASLEAESTGTSITLKVVLMAHLLRDLYRGRTETKLLVFVDEVDTLDDVNQETIRECCRELGFILVMASPNPANAKRLYFLRPEGARTYIHPEEAVEIEFREDRPVSEDNPLDVEEAIEFPAAE